MECITTHAPCKLHSSPGGCFSVFFCFSILFTLFMSFVRPPLGSAVPPTGWHCSTPTYRSRKKYPRSMWDSGYQPAVRCGGWRPTPHAGISNTSWSGAPARAATVELGSDGGVHSDRQCIRSLSVVAQSLQPVGIRSHPHRTCFRKTRQKRRKGWLIRQI